MPKIVLRSLSAGVLFVVGAGMVLLFTPVGDRPLAVLFAVGDVESVEFTEIALADTPNQFLVCPPGFCAANPHAESPVFDVSVEQLRERWREVVGDRPRVELLAEDEERQQYDYVQRSARFRFPDVITVRFVSVSSSQSTLAVYSRAIYGRSDFGVNRTRIEDWLESLTQGQ